LSTFDTRNINWVYFCFVDNAEVELNSQITSLIQLLRLNNEGKQKLFNLLTDLLITIENLPHDWLGKKLESFQQISNISDEEFFRIVYDSILNFSSSGFNVFNDFFEKNLLRLKLGLKQNPQDSSLIPSKSDESEDEFYENLAKEYERSERSKVWIENLKILSSGYYSNLNSFRVLTFEECKALSIAIKDGSDCENSIFIFFEDFKHLYRTPFDIFVLHNLRLVRNLSLRAAMSFPLLEIEDLFQMGVFGLIRAIEKWDWTLGYKFSTYAVWWIRQSIHRFASDNDQLIRIPVHARDKHNSLGYALQERYGLGNEIDLKLGLSKTSFDDREWYDFFVFEEGFIGHESLTRFQYQSGELRIKFSIPNFMADYERDPLFLAEETLLAEQLAVVLDTLTEREAGIIVLRFGLIDNIPKTLEEIGNIYGLSRERIRQIERKTMDKLRHPSRSDVLRDYLD
jgi:RNA polymerase sigma factor (sigma-70 family)